jgi:hypothetical protein
METPIQEDFSNLCPSCKKNPASEPHPCPYGEEIYGSKDECDCCPDCMRQCAEDI